MFVITKVIRGISTIAFLAVLLYVYAYLPEKVSLPIEFADIDKIIVSKGTLFYTMIGLFTLVAILSFWFIKLIDAIPEETANQKKSLINWSSSFAIVINIFLIISIIIIAMINNVEQRASGDYTWLAYLGPVLLFIWLCWLIINLFSRSFSKLSN